MKISTRTNKGAFAFVHSRSRPRRFPAGTPVLIQTVGAALQPEGQWRIYAHLFTGSPRFVEFKIELSPVEAHLLGTQLIQIAEGKV